MNERLNEFVEDNEVIRKQLYQRDRQAEYKTTINKAVVKSSADVASRSRSRSPGKR